MVRPAWLLAALALLTTLTLPACGSRESAPPDDSPARRIVSLSPSFTETLFRLGRGDRVVGRTRWCDTPEAASAVSTVGDAFQVNVEALLATRPDLVIAHSRALIDTLRPLADRLRIRYVANDSIDDVLAAIATLGRLSEATEEATALVSHLRGEIDDARARSAGRARPRVLFLADRDPFYAAGGASYVGALIELAGGENVVGDLDRPYPALSLETILARRPDVIIEGGRGGTGGDAGVRRYWSRFPDLPAVENGRVHALRTDAVNRPGPRLGEAVRELEALIHPEAPR